MGITLDDLSKQMSKEDKDGVATRELASLNKLLGGFVTEWQQQTYRDNAYASQERNTRAENRREAGSRGGGFFSGNTKVVNNNTDTLGGGVGKGLASMMGATGLGVKAMAILGGAGAGIAAFLTAMAGASTAIEKLGGNGASLVPMMTNTAKAFTGFADNMSLKSAGLLAGLLGATGLFGATRTIKAFGGLGTGLALFFTALSLGESGSAWISKELGVDGANGDELNKKTKWLGSFVDMMAGWNKETLITTGALIVGLGASGVLKTIFWKGLGSLAIGIGAFFSITNIMDSIAAFASKTLGLPDDGGMRNMEAALGFVGKLVDVVGNWSVGQLTGVVATVGAFSVFTPLIWKGLAGVVVGMGILFGGISLQASALGWVHTNIDPENKGFGQLEKSLDFLSELLGGLSNFATDVEWETIAKLGAVGALATVGATLGTVILPFLGASIMAFSKFMEESKAGMGILIDGMADGNTAIAIERISMLFGKLQTFADNATWMDLGKGLTTAMVGTITTVFLPFLGAAVAAFGLMMETAAPGLDDILNTVASDKMFTAANRIGDFLKSEAIQGFLNMPFLEKLAGFGTAVGGGVAIAAGFVAIGVVYTAFVGLMELTKTAGPEAAENAKKIIGHLAESMNSLNSIQSNNLTAVADGLKAIGPALVTFYGADGILKVGTVLKDAGSAITDFIFGTTTDGSEKKNIFATIAEMLVPLNDLDISQLGKMDKISESMDKFGTAMGKIMAISPESIKNSMQTVADNAGALIAIQTGLAKGGRHYVFNDEIDFGSGLLSSDLKLAQVGIALDQVANNMNKLDPSAVARAGPNAELTGSLLGKLSELIDELRAGRSGVTPASIIDSSVKTSNQATSIVSTGVQTKDNWGPVNA